MTPEIKKTIAGALAGFAVAFGADVHTWAGSQTTFDFKVAVRRWIGGAVSGALAGAGLSIPG